MPVKVTRFACIHCGPKFVRSSEKTVSDHEARCFRNPARRACQTCWFNNSYVAYMPDGCDHPDIERTALRFDCPGWKSSTNE